MQATHVSWCLLVCYNLIVENLEFGYNSVMPSNTTHRRLMQVTTLLLAMMGLAAFHKDTIHSELSYISFKHPVQVMHPKTTIAPARMYRQQGLCYLCDVRKNKYSRRLMRACAPRLSGGPRFVI